MAAGSPSRAMMERAAACMSYRRSAVRCLDCTRTGCSSCLSSCRRLECCKILGQESEGKSVERDEEAGMMRLARLLVVVLAAIGLVAVVLGAWLFRSGASAR